LHTQYISEKKFGSTSRHILLKVILDWQSWQNRRNRLTKSLPKLICFCDQILRLKNVQEIDDNISMRIIWLEEDSHGK